MDFKCFFCKEMLLSLIVLAVVSCRQDATMGTGVQEGSGILDSIVFKTSSEEYLYLDRRLYPSSTLENAEINVSPELISIERVGDTLFAFLDTEMLNDRENSYLPYVNDSLISNYYPRYYNVTIDDDLPYFVYLRRPGDQLRFIRDSEGMFDLEAAIIRDTVLSVFGNVRVGLSVKEVFEVLHFPRKVVNLQDFTLILCHAAVPYDVWFNRKSESGKCPTKDRPLDVLLRFERSRVILIYIDSQIVYGKGNIWRLEY